MSGSTSGLRVVLADDQAVVREGLTLLLGLLPGVEVVAAAADGAEAVDAVRVHRPDVLLVDLRMPRCDGVEATCRVRAEVPDTEVVVLTTYADDTSILAALRAGARGYLTKDASAEEIDRALRAAARHETLLDPVVQARLVELVTAGGMADAPALPVRLTDRETEVLRAMAEGLPNRAIARRFVISEATVKTHVNNLFAKLGVNDRAAAVALAYRHGLGPVR